MILIRKIKKSRKKRRVIDEKVLDFLDFRKTKMEVEFNHRESANIKCFAVKKRSEIKVTTQLMSGKLLMFAKR